MQSEKIQASHRARIAYVYVRQSSPYQVEHNLESQRLQYQLVEKARQWGFSDVRVIDEDWDCRGPRARNATVFKSWLLK
jgi:ABC-type uncharacterized transport system YnjBCD ATPase subunit